MNARELHTAAFEARRRIYSMFEDEHIVPSERKEGRKEERKKERKTDRREHETNKRKDRQRLSLIITITIIQ